MDKMLKILDAQGDSAGASVSNNCADYETIVGVVKGAINLVCYAIPIIIVVLIIIDVAKVATAGNVDEKMKKEVGQKAATRLIYAVVVFLVPTVVSLIFRIIGSGNDKIDIDDDKNGCNKSLIQIYLDS